MNKKGVKKELDYDSAGIYISPKDRHRVELS